MAIAIRAVVLAVLLGPGAWAAGGAVEVVVHRGDNAHAPENTLAAAKRCVELGVDFR